MAISPLQQRMLMQRLRRDPRLAALVAAQGNGEGGLAELAGLPQGATSLADLAGMSQQPQVVTPARPAPVQQGAEVEAPTDMPQPNFKLEYPRGQSMQTRPVGPGYDGVTRGTTPEAILGEARMKAAAEEDTIRQSAVVPEAIEKILSQREGRIGEDLKEVQEEQKRAGWEALAMAGFKMAQSQSPYFMSALASGMEAGLTGYNSKKMERAERRARLQAQQEDAALQRHREQLSAEDRETQRAAREQARVAQLIGLRQDAGKLAFEEEVRPFAVETAQLEPEKTRAEIGLAKAKTGTERAQAGYYGAQAANVGAGVRGDGTEAFGGFKPGDIRALINNAQNRKARLQVERARAIVSSQKADIDAQIAAIDDEINQYLAIGGLRAAAPVSSSGPLSGIYVPGRGIVPVR